MATIRRPRPTLIAAACLIAGVAIGWGLPRDHRAPRSTDATASVDRGEASPPARQVFSPVIRHDPYVVREQRRLLDMIERQCRATGAHCAEAGSLRRSIGAD